MRIGVNVTAVVKSGESTDGGRPGVHDNTWPAGIIAIRRSIYIYIKVIVSDYSGRALRTVLGLRELIHGDTDNDKWKTPELQGCPPH